MNFGFRISDFGFEDAQSDPVVSVFRSLKSERFAFRIRGLQRCANQKSEIRNLKFR